jgi:hypothetical protein
MSEDLLRPRATCGYRHKVTYDATQLGCAEVRGSESRFAWPNARHRIYISPAHSNVLEHAKRWAWRLLQRWECGLVLDKLWLLPCTEGRTWTWICMVETRTPRWGSYCKNVCKCSVWLNMTPADAAESQPPVFVSDAACDVNPRVNMHDPFRGVTVFSASENAQMGCGRSKAGKTPGLPS